MTVIYVADEHHRLYWHWKERGERGLKLCHVDFHCDMRGLLIDRPRQEAAVFDDRELGWVDQGNFMTHAVREGTVDAIRWVHAARSGRRYDHNTVRYEDDLRVRLSRRRGSHRRPLRFREEDLSSWQGPQPGEHLDLDWDALASNLYTPAYARALKEAFLAMPFTHRPEVVYFIYSFCSSVIDDVDFEGFLDRLQHKLDAEVIRLSPLAPERSTVTREQTRYQQVRARLIAPLKRSKLRLSSTLKLVDTANDLRFPYPVE